MNYYITQSSYRVEYDFRNAERGSDEESGRHPASGVNERAPDSGKLFAKGLTNATAFGKNIWLDWRLVSGAGS
jgi:hypothetical protein